MHSTAFLENILSVAASSEFLSVSHETNPTIEAYYHAAEMTGLMPSKTISQRPQTDCHIAALLAVKIHNRNSKRVDSSTSGGSYLFGVYFLENM